MVTFFAHSLGKIGLAVVTIVAFAGPVIQSQGCAVLALVYLGLVCDHSSYFSPNNDSHKEWDVAQARRLPAA